MNTEISIFCEVVSEREVQKDGNLCIQAEEERSSIDMGH